MLVEVKQLDGGSIPGEDREIHSFPIDSSTEWMGSPGLSLERNRGCRFPNIDFPLGHCNGGGHGKDSSQVVTGN
jgi:hypothetical protein